jgi:hypothetical protein
VFKEDEWKGMLSKLLQLTKENKLKWQINATNGVEAAVGKVRYNIDSVDNDGAPPFKFEVITNEDIWTQRVIDSIVSTPINDGKAQSLVSPLRDAAYRVAVGGDQLARDLLDDLFAIDPTPPTEPDVSWRLPPTAEPF